MKSPWLWIVGIVIVLWLFSGEKNSATSPFKDQENLSLPNRQAAPAYQQTTTPVYSSPTFMGYPCTDDCSGHEAGYEWAEENGIDDPDDCDGNSDSFIEGCQAYAEEQQTSEGGQDGEE